MYTDEEMEENARKVAAIIDKVIDIIRKDNCGTIVVAPAFVTLVIHFAMKCGLSKPKFLATMSNSWEMISRELDKENNEN